MRIVLGAVISLSPFSAGMAWNWLQTAVGLRRLGHKVYYVEHIQPRWCVNAQGRPCPLAESANQQLFRSLMQRFGLMDHACQIYDDGCSQTTGLPLDELLRQVHDADLLINMGGHITHEPLLAAVRRRVYVDQDPVYTQLWHAQYNKNLHLDRHDVFVSVGLNIGTPMTPIPDCGIRWRHMLPPVLLDAWPVTVDPSCRRFTTIASWCGFSSLCYQGQWYTSKYEEFMRYAPLPTKVDQAFEVAMRRYRDEEQGIQLLRNHGWHVFDSSGLFDLDSYQRYIAGSRAEIGIAKNAYVKAHSGWFSDRAAHYLASGKPVLAQATGFEDHLPTGHGLLTFASMDDAVAAVAEINRDYAGHCHAAREFAREYLDYRRVIPSLLEAAYAVEHEEIRHA